MRLSIHTEKRCQQRGIKWSAVEVVRRFGTRRYSRDGISYAMDKQAHRKARNALGEAEYGRLEKHLGIYLIVSLDHEDILTVAHRLRRWRNYFKPRGASRG